MGGWESESGVRGKRGGTNEARHQKYTRKCVS